MMVEFYFESAAMIVTLISVGKTLEARAKGRTSEAISRLLDLAPRRATVIRDGVETEIDASELVVGDEVLVRDGQSVPTDGVILEGHGALDQSMLTGESLPVELGVGDSVVGPRLRPQAASRPAGRRRAEEILESGRRHGNPQAADRSCAGNGLFPDRAERRGGQRARAGAVSQTGLSRNRAHPKRAAIRRRQPAGRDLDGAAVGKELMSFGKQTVPHREDAARFFRLFSFR